MACTAICLSVGYNTDIFASVNTCNTSITTPSSEDNDVAGGECIVVNEEEGNDDDDDDVDEVLDGCKSACRRSRIRCGSRN